MALEERDEEVMTCELCGEEFYPSDSDANDTTNYCSIECENEGENIDDAEDDEEYFGQ